MNQNEDEIARRSNALLRRLPSVTIRREGKEVQVKYDPGLLTPHRAWCIFVAGMATSIAPLGIAYGHFMLTLGILMVGAFCLFDGLNRPEEQKPSKWDALTDESTHDQPQIADASAEASLKERKVQIRLREQNLQARNDHYYFRYR